MLLPLYLCTMISRMKPQGSFKNIRSDKLLLHYGSSEERSWRPSVICDPLIPAISLLTCLTPSPIPLAVAHSRSSLLELFGLPHSHQNLAHSLTFQWLLTLSNAFFPWYLSCWLLSASCPCSNVSFFWWPPCSSPCINSYPHVLTRLLNLFLICSTFL